MNTPTLPLPTNHKRKISDGEAPSLARVTNQARHLPNRAVLHCLQKWGKTSFAAQAHAPIFLMTRGEDGLLTLMDNGQLSPTAHFPECLTTWLDLKLAIHELIVQPHDYKTLVLDTLNGAERLGHEHFVEQEMSGDWDKFDAYGRGPKLAVKFFIELTQLLDRVREKGMSIMLLCHSQVKTFNNPEGANYDRWEPVLSKEAWAHIDRWVDMILFGNFFTVADAKRGQDKAKAQGGQQRILCTERTAAYDAGNRHGLPPEIDCGASPKEAWTNFINALKAKK
jgi:AAA domain